MTLSELVKSKENHIKEFLLKNLSGFDQRQFDTAYKAVNKQELEFVIENTRSREIQDYAILKLNLFNSKTTK